MDGQEPVNLPPRASKFDSYRWHMSRPKARSRVMFPWEYDAFVETERKADHLRRNRKRQKALSKVEKQRQRARRNREDRNRPLDAGMPKMIRPWPQGWRVPTATLPMTAKEYARYLETPHWQEFRDKYRASAHLQECFVCGDTEFELHHHTYTRIGNEGLLDVVPLCGTHHRAAHKAVKSGVSLTNAHTYVKMRYQRNELETRNSTLTTE